MSETKADALLRVRHLGVSFHVEDRDVPAPEKSADVIALDEALTRLAAFDPRKSRVVELRIFGGMTIEETAEALGVSIGTVKNDYRAARAWLRREMGKGR